jgi:hypothetical protein
MKQWIVEKSLVRKKWIGVKNKNKILKSWHICQPSGTHAKKAKQATKKKRRSLLFFSTTTPTFGR